MPWKSTETLSFIALKCIIQLKFKKEDLANFPWL